MICFLWASYFSTYALEDLVQALGMLPWTDIFQGVELSTSIFFLEENLRLCYSAPTDWEGLYDLLHVDDNSGPVCLDDPIMRAVAKKSESMVRHLLKVREDAVTPEEFVELMWRATDWPVGLELIIALKVPSSYLDHDVPGEHHIRNNFTLLLGHNMDERNNASVNVLIRSPWLDHRSWPSLASSLDIEYVRMLASAEPRSTA